MRDNKKAGEKQYSGHKECCKKCKDSFILRKTAHFASSFSGMLIWNLKSFSYYNNFFRIVNMLFYDLEAVIILIPQPLRNGTQTDSRLLSHISLSDSLGPTEGNRIGLHDQKSLPYREPESVTEVKYFRLVHQRINYLGVFLGELKKQGR